jgi:hypothetical protein
MILGALLSKSPIIDHMADRKRKPEPPRFRSTIKKSSNLSNQVDFHKINKFVPTIADILD